MATLGTTKLSSKGQVVIPEEIRRRLGLEEGAQFVVLGEGDVVILKLIKAPEVDVFDHLIGRAHSAAREAGLNSDAVRRAVARARSKEVDVQDKEDRMSLPCLCCLRETPITRPRVCPACDHVFRGNGWDGIDAHWRSRHERWLSYERFWQSLCPAHRD